MQTRSRSKGRSGADAGQILLVRCIFPNKLRVATTTTPHRKSVLHNRYAVVLASTNARTNARTTLPYLFFVCSYKNEHPRRYFIIKQINPSGRMVIQSSRFVQGIAEYLMFFSCCDECWVSGCVLPLGHPSPLEIENLKLPSFCEFLIWAS